MLLEPALLAGPLERLRAANQTFARRFPGERVDRQPVHTVYGGAHIFRAETARKLGDVALRALDEYAPDAASLAAAVDIADPAIAERVHARVREKLRREPVEDFRIDFEDGYGIRPDAEEDGHAEAAGREVARGLAEGGLPPFLGIRIKPFSDCAHGRSVRTLDLFIGALARASGGRLPPNFVVTLPKVTVPEQVAALAGVADALESTAGLPAGALRCELMVETPQSILAADGTCPLPRMIEASRGRCTSLHFGTYDYTAGCGISAAHQAMGHPACDFAKHVMQVALAGTGLWISDGATTIMPVPPHRPPRDDEEAAHNRRVVWSAWKRHHDDVRRSLMQGWYQGWDLHPAQLVTRYAAVYAFFLESLEAASQRLRTFVEKAARATLVGDVFDDAATGQGLLNYFLRAVNCGAISLEEAQATGLSLDEIRGRSFANVLQDRKAGP